MIELVWAALELASAHIPLVLACVLVFAMIEATFGLGVLFPGETGVVLAATALAESPQAIAAAVVTAAAGAFLGDQLGFLLGRRGGDRLGDSRVVRRLGPQHWQTARTFVARRFVMVIIARLLPGVRTFISAAAGASSMPYRRFVVISLLATLTWASLWVVGGALAGRTLLDLVEHFTVPVLIGAAVVALALTLVRIIRMRVAR